MFQSRMPVIIWDAIHTFVRCPLFDIFGLNVSSFVDPFLCFNISFAESAFICASQALLERNEQSKRKN